MHSDDIFQEDMPNQEITLEEVIEEATDVRNKDFTISRSVILDTASVLENTDLSRTIFRAQSQTLSEKAR